MSGYTGSWVVVVYSRKGLSGMGGSFAALSFAMAAMVDVLKVFKRIEKNSFNEFAIGFNMNYYTARSGPRWSTW